MKLIIFGGTGLIGQEFIHLFEGSGYELFVVSRNSKKVNSIFQDQVHPLQWSKKKEGLSNLKKQFSDEYAIINLAGENIGGKYWTKKQKQKLIRSRIEITKTISQLINEASIKPKVVLQGSATGFYGSDYNAEFEEISPKGNGFLADLTEQWEHALDIQDTRDTRVVFLRTGLVLSNRGGLLPKLVLPFKFWVGGHFGDGRQWMPWIHIKDEVYAMKFLLENKECHGIYNLTSSQAVQMKAFCKTLGKRIRRPSWFHVPGFMLKFFLGEMADELLLSSQHVLPKRLENDGYSFKFAPLEEALKDLLKK